MKTITTDQAVKVLEAGFGEDPKLKPCNRVGKMKENVHSTVNFDLETGEGKRYAVAVGCSGDRVSSVEHLSTPAGAVLEKPLTIAAIPAWMTRRIEGFIGMEEEDVVTVETRYMVYLNGARVGRRMDKGTGKRGLSYPKILEPVNEYDNMADAGVAAKKFSDYLKDWKAKPKRRTTRKSKA